MSREFTYATICYFVTRLNVPGERAKFSGLTLKHLPLSRRTSKRSLWRFTTTPDAPFKCAAATSPTIRHSYAKCNARRMLYAITLQFLRLVELLLAISSTVSLSIPENFSFIQSIAHRTSCWSTLKVSLSTINAAVRVSAFPRKLSYPCMKIALMPPTISCPCQILIFERDGAGVWTHQADVGSCIRQACPIHVWRTRLSLYGNTLAVGGGARGPYTYVFARDAIGLWTLEAKLTSVDTVPGDWLGYVISLHGDVLAISAEKDDDKGLNAGAVYIYTRADNIWTRSTKLLATDGTAGDQFGYGLTLGARTLVIGAYGVSDQGIDRGAAYVYSTSPKSNKSSAPMSDFENESSAPMSGYRCRVLIVALVMLLQFFML